MKLVLPVGFVGRNLRVPAALLETLPPETTTIFRATSRDKQEEEQCQDPEEKPQHGDG